MPDLPKYNRRVTVKPVGKAPLPVGAADVGAGAIGQGLQAVGKSVSDIGQALLKVEQQKQQIRDDALLSSANGDRNQQIADSMREADKTVFADITEFYAFRKKMESDLDAIEQQSMSKMSKRAAETFSNFTKTNRQTALRQMERIVWEKEVKFQQYEAKRQYSNLFENMSVDIPYKDMLENPELDIIEKGARPYFATGELENLRDETLVDSLLKVGRFDDAAKFVSGKENDFTVTEKKTRLNEIRISKQIAEANAKERKKELIDTATSETINKFFRKELTAEELFGLHKAGFVRDAEFKSMIETLTATAPETSSPIAKGRINRAVASFHMGAINRSEANKVVLQNYKELDKIDRESVYADLEDAESQIIALAKTNAYNDGRTMISKEFIGIEDEEDLLKLLLGTKGLTEAEKEKINQRWVAEMDNRRLYESAVNQRFRELRSAGVSDGEKYRTEALDIMLQYRRNKSLSLPDLQEKVSAAQKKAITPKPISEMTLDEKKAELEKIRSLRELTK